MTIEQEFNCLGYYGFGSGVKMARRQIDPGVQKVPAYCQSCILAKACWEAHRARVHQLVPDLAKHVDELGKQGTKKVMEFIQQNGTEPFMAIMMGNMEDAMYFIATGKPKDRGPSTLTIPFPND